jgi:hypothetical protein
MELHADHLFRISHILMVESENQTQRHYNVPVLDIDSEEKIFT